MSFATFSDARDPAAKQLEDRVAAMDALPALGSKCQGVMITPHYRARHDYHYRGITTHLALFAPVDAVKAAEGAEAPKPLRFLPLVRHHLRSYSVEPVRTTKRHEVPLPKAQAFKEAQAAKAKAKAAR